MARRSKTVAQPVMPLMLPDDQGRSVEAMPVSIESLRLELLRTAGVDIELLRTAVDMVRASMKATKVHVVSHQGVVTEQVEMADWAAIQRGCDQLFNLLGMYAPRRSESVKDSPAPRAVMLPSWAQVKPAGDPLETKGQG